MAACRNVRTGNFYKFISGIEYLPPRCFSAVLARWSWGGKSFGVSPVNGTSNPGSAATATRSLMAHLRGQLGWMPSNGERRVPRAIACTEQIDPQAAGIKGKVALLRRKGVQAIIDRTVRA